MLQNVLVDEASYREVEWQDCYYKFCQFRQFSPEGILCSADFSHCQFDQLDWYSGSFHSVTFMACRFQSCVFRGTSFWDCRFIQCVFIDCLFVADNLGGVCIFDGTQAWDSQIQNCLGHGFKQMKLVSIASVTDV